MQQTIAFSTYVLTSSTVKNLRKMSVVSEAEYSLSESIMALYNISTSVGTISHVLGDSSTRLSLSDVVFQQQT